MPGALYYGDNLSVLREHIPDASVDLIYLDPPFNSNATYNVLFRSPKGERSAAQIQAFDDTWCWGEEAETAYDDVMQSGSEAAGLLRALRSFLRENDLMAYLAMMAIRLIEMHRVLKPTGSFYLHCDPTASHYLKLLLDGIFGAERFLNEITWRRTTAHNDPKRYGRVGDRIIYYSKGPNKIFNSIPGSYSEEQLSRYKYKDARGLFRAENLTAPHYSPTRTVTWRGTHPGENRQWRFSMKELERLYQDGRILLRRDGCPRKDGLKEYLDAAGGPPLQDIWGDIGIGPTAGERLGYPTQKPLMLLERIIQASSNLGDVVLDPFCGCGTTVHAAEKLGRSWIGIDVTHIAIQIIEDRLRKHFPTNRPAIIGRPKDLDAARDLAARDKYQFQWWATWLARGHPRGGLKKGADRGVDGDIWFRYGVGADGHAVISVKGGTNISPQMIRDLRGVREREDAEIGVFVCLEPPTGEMIREAVSAGFLDSPVGRIPRIQILTIADLLAGSLPKLPPVYDTVTAAEAGRKTAAKARRSIRQPSTNQREILYPFSGGIQQSLLFAAEPRPEPLQESVETETRKTKRRSRRL